MPTISLTSLAYTQRGKYILQHFELTRRREKTKERDIEGERRERNKKRKNQVSKERNETNIVRKK